MSNGKNRITFYYLPHRRAAMVQFGVQTSDSDYDRSGLPFRVPSVLGKRRFFALHFNPFFNSFPSCIRLLRPLFKFLGLRSLARVSGTDPRQWAFICKGLTPAGATIQETATPAVEPLFLPKKLRF